MGPVLETLRLSRFARADVADYIEYLRQAERAKGSGSGSLDKV
jgi:hypothetical protein